MPFSPSSLCLTYIHRRGVVAGGESLTAQVFPALLNPGTMFFFLREKVFHTHVMEIFGNEIPAHSFFFLHKKKTRT